MNTHPQHPLTFRTWFPFSMLAGLLVMSGACATVSPAEIKLMAQQKYEDSQKPGNTKKEKYRKLMEAIRMAPKEPLYRVGLGDAYFKDEQYDKAEKMYLSAIKADPEYPITYRMLGRLYMQKGQWNDATIYLTKAIRQPNVINPIQLYNWLGYSEYRKGDLPKAEKAWLRALDINDSDKIRLNLALIYKEGNQLDLAQASLLKALEMNPKLPSAHFALAEIYYQRNKFSKAKEHFNEVIHLEPLSEQAKVSQEILNKLSAN
ncbi:MAG: tetratricopeptide repeat protein [Nitrospinota bacterium]|nr:tetratricopeptide repeat protein [Nitrospinota bacterium]